MSLDVSSLMRRWQAGWVTSRGYVTLGADAQVIDVQMGYPGREVEHVALSDDPSVHASLLGRLAGRPGHCLTLPTSDRIATERLVRDAGYAHREPEWLMMFPSLADHPTTTAHEFEVVHTSRDDVHVVEVATADGNLAAKGQVAVVGSDAVADRIFTMPSYRRRGLGRLVMGRLAGAASGHGARTGLLGASVDGRALYEALGWHVVAGIVLAGHPEDLQWQAAPQPASTDPLE